MSLTDVRGRLKNALWGLFIGDSLSMPVHWYYNRDNIKKDYPEGIRGYKNPKHPHPEAFMVGMKYTPDVETARRMHRPYDILHRHVRFYRTNYSDFTIERNDREGEHGNAVAAEEKRYHYHHGMAAGENTLGAHLVRVMMRSITDNNGYDKETFTDYLIRFLADPESCNDPYREVYMRSWFENYTSGEDSLHCAELQSRNWSIGSHGGMIRPMVLSLMSGDSYQGLGDAVEHQNITHRSENIISALSIVVPMLNDLINGKPVIETITTYSKRIRLPKVSGEELFQEYRSADGPGNKRFYRLHNDREAVDGNVRKSTGHF